MLWIDDPYVQSACLTSPEQRVARKAKAVQLRRKFSYGSGSDLVAARNAYAGCLGESIENTQERGVSIARMKCFRDEGADIAARLLAFLEEESPGNPPRFTRSDSAGRILRHLQAALRQNHQLEDSWWRDIASRDEDLVWLQVLAGAPQWFCGRSASLSHAKLEQAAAAEKLEPHEWFGLDVTLGSGHEVTKQELVDLFTGLLGPNIRAPDVKQVKKEPEEPVQSYLVSTRNSEPSPPHILQGGSLTCSFASQVASVAINDMRLAKCDTDDTLREYSLCVNQDTLQTPMLILSCFQLFGLKVSR